MSDAPAITKKVTIILDPGHGGMINGEYQTAGKRSPILPNGDIVYEGVINREIVRLIHMKLLQRGFHSIILVKEQEDISLQERVRRANEIAKVHSPCIYLSIHLNAHQPDPDELVFTNAKGWEAWTSVGATLSDACANEFYFAIKSFFKGWNIRVDTIDGDPDKEANLYVLKNTSMPAVLTENGFMTNQIEAMDMLDVEWRLKIAEAHVEAIESIEELNLFS